MSKSSYETGLADGRAIESQSNFISRQETDESEACLRPKRRRETDEEASSRPTESCTHKMHINEFPDIKHTKRSDAEFSVGIQVSSLQASLKFKCIFVFASIKIGRPWRIGRESCTTLPWMSKP